MDPKEKLIKELIDEGYLKTPAIIEAFKAIDRAEFVAPEYKTEAYGNYPLPIGFGQTISQPLTVAFMLELLEPKKGEKILDVGCGSGWQTALLAQIVSDPIVVGEKVVGIERIPELAAMAERNVAKFNFIDKEIVRIIVGDGSLGFAEEAPFDKIIAAAASDEIPAAWKEQLKVGGRMVAPVNESIHLLIKKGKEEFEERKFFGFSFVPLIKGV